MRPVLALFLAAGMALAAMPARALPMANSPPNAPVASSAPPKTLENVGITERLGERVPEDVVLAAPDGAHSAWASCSTAASRWCSRSSTTTVRCPADCSWAG